ncbi:MAG: hypothetical protein ACRERY_18765 [Pseudomonas sp.]
MRPAPSFLLFAVLTCAPQLQAEEPAPAPLTAPPMAEVNGIEPQIEELEQQLAESERLRAELASKLEATAGERENAQLRRLRQENQRLKLQLKEAQAARPSRLLSEQQLWFIIGGGVATLAFGLGVLLRGNRRTRREWLN